MSCPTCEAIRMILLARGFPPAQVASMPINEIVAPIEKKIKGKVSAYNREYKKQFARLRKKHPRTNFSTLVKRAHKATKEARK